jgi:hypothetical protein
MFSSNTLSISHYVCKIPICEIPNVTIYSHIQVVNFKHLELYYKDSVLLEVFLTQLYLPPGVCRSNIEKEKEVTRATLRA